MVRERRPISLTVAAGLVGVEAAALVVWAVLELVTIGGADSPGSAAGVAVFFLLCGAALAACARGLFGLSSWARAPVVLTQLIVLGLAWNARHSATALAVGLVLLAVIELVSLFHPRSTDALAAEDESE